MKSRTRLPGYLRHRGTPRSVKITLRPKIDFHSRQNRSKSILGFVALIAVAALLGCLASDHYTALWIFALASTITLTTSSDQSIGASWSKNGFSGTYAAAMSDGSDTTYGSVSSNSSGASGAIGVYLSALPGNVTAISAIQISLRVAVSSTKGSSFIEASVGTTSGSVTHFSSNINFTPTTSFSTITTSATLNDSTVSDWNTLSPTIWITAPGDGNSNTLKVAEASVILTVTLASAPGTPTGLVASYSSPTAVTLTWTQGSGTVTDNKVKYGTDGTTFGTTVDQGSAVTTATITGLTTNQLYFFEVDAENTNGASAYTAPVPFVCGWNLAVQVSQSSDDAYQTGSTVTLTDASKAPGASSLIGWLFRVVANANLPIVNVAIYFYLTANSSPAGSISFDCQLSTAPATFTTGSNNISARSLTGASTSIAANLFVGTGWNNVASVALTNALATIFNQPGWASNGNVAVIANFNASFTGLTFEMQDGNPVQAAILAIQTGANPVFPGISVGSGSETSGLVCPAPVMIQTAVRRAAW
jgi:hypothetical protein